MKKIVSTRNAVCLMGLALAASICSGCEYFSNVVIPEKDETDPQSIAGIYDVVEGKYVALDFGTPYGPTGQFRFTVTDPEKTYLAVGATLDQGGAQQVHIRGDWWYRCTNRASGQSYLGDVYNDGPDLNEFKSQSGLPGQTVSNGLWTYFAVRFDQAPPCRPGYKRDGDISFHWSVWSMDFAGNRNENRGVMIFHGPKLPFP